MKNDLWTYLKTAKKPIVLYGMGNGADKIIAELEKHGISISGVFASDGFVREKYFHGLKVEHYSALKSRFGDMIVLLCFGTSLDDVIENINKIALEQELYAPDVSVCGDTIFDSEYVRKNEDALKYVYSLLADDLSKKTFYDTVMYKLSGEIKYLYDCEVSENEPYENFLKLGKNETYVDFGAYRGDTVLDFLSRVDNYTHIYAVEPDRKSYNKMCLILKDIKNIKLINACASDVCGNISFDMDGSRASAIKDGGVLIPSVTLDTVSNNQKITLVKMDIEGAEKQAIIGGKQIIRQFKPKMQIACYHRSEDLTDIVQSVLSIRNDYKIYMRHFKSLPVWDTNFYFI
ncbi:MAG: FkbM family methyltransferase [Clostridia bacterium]|nr:FkbM family methyltransferase [Clostridia bacterium]